MLLNFHDVLFWSLISLNFESFHNPWISNELNCRELSISSLTSYWVLKHWISDEYCRKYKFLNVRLFSGLYETVCLFCGLRLNDWTDIWYEVQFWLTFAHLLYASFPYVGHLLLILHNWSPHEINRGHLGHIEFTCFKLISLMATNLI